VCDKTGVVKACKDGEDRFVPMSRQLAAWLREHRSDVELEAQVRGWTLEQRALVFPNRWGKLGRYSAFLEHVWQPLQKAGLRYWKPHSMRHTFATWALEGNEEKGLPPPPSSPSGTGWAMPRLRRRRAISTVIAPGTREW
jgi:integrase